MIQTGKYKSTKQKLVGKYKSVKVSREIQVGDYKSKQYWKIPIGKHKSENNNSEHTNRKIQIGKIQIGEYYSE